MNHWQALALSVSAIIALSEPAIAQSPHACATFINQNPATLAFLRVGRLKARDVLDANGIKIGSIADSTAAESPPIGNGGDPVGYTRLLVEFTSCDAKPKDYPSEKRGFIKQFFAGKEVDKSLKVLATIKPINVPQSLALFHVNRQSGKTGEAWNTQISNGQNLSRYFLVDRSTAVSLEFSFAENSKYTGAVAGSLFDIVERAAALIAPASILITADNKKRFSDAAKFADDSLNGLMATDVKEDATVEQRIGEADGNKTLAVVALFAPDANSTIRGEYQPIGIWTVKTDEIQPALLGRMDGDHLDISKLSAATVLSFKTDSEQTLGQLLAGRTSVSQAKEAYLKAENPKKAAAAQALCSTVATEVANLGMSPADVGGAVWAYAKIMEPVPAAKSVLQTNCKSVDQYPG